MQSLEETKISTPATLDVFSHALLNSSFEIWFSSSTDPYDQRLEFGLKINRSQLIVVVRPD